jgi:hypothetical protein
MTAYEVSQSTVQRRTGCPQGRPLTAEFIEDYLRQHEPAALPVEVRLVAPGTATIVTAARVSDETRGVFDHMRLVGAALRYRVR